jgi:choline kinase
MQAIILAAGAGTRVGLNLPKCLIEIHGKTLLQNQVETLRALDDTILISVVTGFKNRLVEQEVYSLHKIHPLIRAVHNSEAQNMGIVRSLEAANDTIVENQVLRISGDIYFSPSANIQEIVRGGDALAVQNVPSSRGETVVCRNDDLILTSNHSTDEIEWLDIDYYDGNSFKNIMQISSWYRDTTQHFYELLRHAIKVGTYTPRFVNLEGVYEIDTQEDFEYVKRLF